MKSISSFFNNMCKGKKLVLLLTPILTTILSMKGTLLGLLLLILLDLFTGIRKNLHKNNSKGTFFFKSIKSYLLRQTWRKAYEYGIGIIVIIVFESMVLGMTPINLFGKVFTISQMSVLIACAVEVWSVFENMEAVSGNNLLKRLKGFLPEKLQKLFTSQDEENN